MTGQGTKVVMAFLSAWAWIFAWCAAVGAWAWWRDRNG